MEAVATLSDTSTVTQQITEVDASTSTAPVLRLRLKKPKSERKVEWRDDTIDNEHMNRKKSKCCCIYRKPVSFGESSSEDDEECENCFGHPEKKRRNKKKKQPDEVATDDTDDEHQCKDDQCSIHHQNPKALK